MQLGGVALVLVETIFGKLRAEVTHDPVARHFRDHARGRDGQTVAIAVDDCRLRTWEWKNGKTVNKDVFGRDRERRKRDPHGFVRCTQNVDSIDFQMIDHPDTPRDFAV